MKLREILFNFIDSKEIKIRLNNKQIKVNNEIITNRELEIPIQSLDNSDLGCFLCDNNVKIPSFMDIRDFFGEEDTNIKELQKFDTIYQIETNEKVYVFTKTQEYKGVYPKITQETFFLGFVIGICIILYIFAIFIS